MYVAMIICETHVRIIHTYMQSSWGAALVDSHKEE